MSIRYWVCPHESFRSAWITRQIRAQKKIGFYKWWNGWAFDTRVARPMVLPEVLRVSYILTGLAQISKLSSSEAENSVYKMAGLLKNRLDKKISDKRFHNLSERQLIRYWPHKIEEDFNLYVQPAPELERSLILKLRLMRPYVVVAPSSQWATKRWTDEGFTQLIQLLTERGLNVYLVGAKSETEHCLKIEGAASSFAKHVEVRSLAGQTDLVTLHALLAMAEVVVTNDSGPMHMAAAAGRPVVGIFGPTTINLGYRPWSDQSQVVQVNLPCRPCGAHGHNKCPIGTHDCMKKISAAQVMTAVDELQRGANGR